MRASLLTPTVGEFTTALSALAIFQRWFSIVTAFRRVDLRPLWRMGLLETSALR
jgi:hypothetical protein